MENDCPHFRGPGEVVEENPVASNAETGNAESAGSAGKPAELSEAEKAKLEKKRARLIKKAIKLGFLKDEAEGASVDMDSLSAMVKAKSINAPGEEGDDDEDGGDAA
jgi:hypothetical protein